MNCSNFKMRVRKIIVRRIFQTPVGAGTGLEPVTSGLWGRRAAICSIPPYGRRRRLPVGARRRIHVVLMMGCACLGLSRGRPISLHSPFFRCVGAGHVAAGRRSCCLFHIFHRRTHIGLAAIAIHHTHHPFLKITGHYPGDAILRGRKTRVTFSKALVAANPFREECVAPCSRDRALSASHVRFNRCP